MTLRAVFAGNPLDAANPPCYIGPQFRRSSAVEQLTVNQLVVGSIPTAGANFYNHHMDLRLYWDPCSGFLLVLGPEVGPKIQLFV
jgi:hypothetical protein